MSDSLRIDVVIPAYNRSAMLRKTLDSILAARIPDGLEVRVTVVDNNSPDDTRLVAQAYEPKFQGRFKYIFEPRQGKSHALNAGIAGTNGDIVGMIDDDERVDPRWFEVIREWFTRNDVDFIGGPYKPDWEIQPPAWLPPDYHAVISVTNPWPHVATFGVDYPGMLIGGNAVIRRSILERVGPYSPSASLGKTGKPFSSEDDDMYERLIAAGARGKFVPDLIIYHHIPASRLTKSYHRRWRFWKGALQSIRTRERRKPVPHLLGVPRYHYGHTLRSSGRAIKKLFAGKLTSPEAFSSELAWWFLAGFLYGRHFHSREE